MISSLSGIVDFRICEATATGAPARWRSSRRARPVVLRRLDEGRSRLRRGSARSRPRRLRRWRVGDSLRQLRCEAYQLALVLAHVRLERPARARRSGAAPRRRADTAGSRPRRRCRTRTTTPRHAPPAPPRWRASCRARLAGDEHHCRCPSLAFAQAAASASDSAARPNMPTVCVVVSRGGNGSSSGSSGSHFTS